MPVCLIHKAEGNLVCGFHGEAPRSTLCQLATIPAVANSTQQELRAHVGVALQRGVLPKVSCTFSWSKDASPGGAVVCRAQSRNQGAGMVAKHPIAKHRDMITLVMNV